MKDRGPSLTDALLLDLGIRKVTWKRILPQRLEIRRLATIFWIIFACCGVILAPLTSTCVLCNIRKLLQINQLQNLQFGLRLAMSKKDTGHISHVGSFTYYKFGVLAAASD